VEPVVPSSSPELRLPEVPPGWAEAWLMTNLVLAVKLSPTPLTRVRARVLAEPEVTPVARRASLPRVALEATVQEPKPLVVNPAPDGLPAPLKSSWSATSPPPCAGTAITL